VDATIGLGGHALAILERIQPDGLLIGVDRDSDSLERARQLLEPYSKSLRLYHENFKNLPLILNNLKLPLISGILVDLGISSFQLLSEERGFSFQGEGLLDMRMDRTQQLTATKLVNELPEAKLADIIYQFGEERSSRRIAAAIAAARREGSITRCSHLADIVRSAVRGGRSRSIHPATKTFQAIRIAVNQELEGLEDFLVKILSYLQAGSRIVVISFHSLEDRIVKRAFRMLSGQCVCRQPVELCRCPKQALARLTTQKPRSASSAEVPRARSARLRTLERI